jgi:hypothetical protein
LAADRPVLIDAVTDPAVPTVPPDPSEKVLEKIAQALAQEGEPLHVRRQLAREGVNLAGNEGWRVVPETALNNARRGGN